MVKVEETNHEVIFLYMYMHTYFFNLYGHIDIKSSLYLDSFNHTLYWGKRYFSETPTLFAFLANVIVIIDVIPWYT